MTLFTFADHDIVASFIVNKSVSLLEDNKIQLADEIFDEIDAPSSKVPLFIFPSISFINVYILILSLFLSR